SRLGPEAKMSLFPTAANRKPERCCVAWLFFGRPARGSVVGSPGRRIGSRKRVGNSAPRETFRTGRRKARAESRFRWWTKRRPVRGTLLAPFEPPLRAAVAVDAPLSVDIEDRLAACDPADDAAVDGIRFDSAHSESL